MVADKATLPPTAPTAGLCRRLLSKKTAINAASVVAGIVAAGTAYIALSLVVGMGLGAGALQQVERVRLATGLILSSRDFVPAIGSVSSILLGTIIISVPAGALACGLAAYRSTKRWLGTRFTMEA